MPLFLYDKDSVPKEALKVIITRGFNCIPLTSNADDFWANVNALSAGDTLALLSHGDESGPLMVEGDEGDDWTEAEILTFGSFLKDRGITLFLLSCHTGKGAFFEALVRMGVQFVAPLGFAVFESGGGGINVFSKEGSKHVGWSGTATKLIPRRATTSLYFNPV